MTKARRSKNLITIAAALAAPVALIFFAPAGGRQMAAAADNGAAPASDAPLIAPADAPVGQNADPAKDAASHEFDLGEQALHANHPAEAIAHYKAVVDNRYADEATVRKATEQLALAQAELAKQSPAQSPAAVATPAAAPAPAVDPQRQLYDQAVADVHADRLDKARQELQTLVADNYQPPIFSRTPAELLAEVQVRTGQPAPAAPVQLAAAEDTTVPSVPPAALTNPPANAPQAPPPSDTAAPTVPPSSLTNPPPLPPPVVPATNPTALNRLQAETANEKLAAEQQQFRARGLVDLARQAYSLGDKDEALRDYTQAAELDPANQAAQAGKAQLLQETGRAAPAATSSQFRNALEIEIQDINFRFNTAIRDAKSAIAVDDFATATKSLEDARIARSMDPGIFPQEQLREMDATIAQVEQQLKDERASYDQRTASATQTEIQRQAQERADRQREERDRTVASLIKVSREDIDNNNYTAALGVLDQILVLDPKNDYARGVRQFVEDRAILQDQRRSRELFDTNLSKQLDQAEEDLIPYNDIIVYPTNWPDISQKRDEETQNERGLTHEDQATEALLDKVLPETNFEGTTFADAIDYLRDTTGANIFVNNRALEAAGVEQTAPITLKLHGVKFSKALSTILDLVGGQTKLSYDLDDGVITISTAEQLNQNVATDVYDIRDLLVTTPNIQLSDVTSALSSASSGGGGSTTFGGTGNTGATAQTNSNSNAFSSNSGNNNQNNTQQSMMLQASLIKLITDTVATETWKTNGGTVGAISQLQGQGQIVVTQTPENQRKLVDLLDKIREKRDIMVTVECRFLTVSRDFIENIGLNLSATFNTNRQSNSVFSYVPVQINSTGFTSGVSTGVPGSIGSGATPASIAFSYLDDFQVNMMLEAVEASNTSTLANAPRVTVFDGGSAVLAVGTTFSYVSNLTPIVGSGGSVGYTATVTTGLSGVELFVQATVSADRKYVTLYLTPTLQGPPTLTPFQLTTPASNSTTTAGGGTVITTGSTSSAVAETIQLNSQTFTSVETLVSVPDGGTLLLGGQTVAGEAEREQGVPVLSKIPFLKRLFTNTGEAKDEQIVLILVKPTILIQREQEDKFFPLLSNKATGG